MKRIYYYVCMLRCGKLHCFHANNEKKPENLQNSNFSWAHQRTEVRKQPCDLKSKALYLEEDKHSLRQAQEGPSPHKCTHGACWKLRVVQEVQEHWENLLELQLPLSAKGHSRLPLRGMWRRQYRRVRTSTMNPTHLNSD